MDASTDAVADAGADAAGDTEKLPSRKNVVLALGTSFSCALFASGDVKCWGVNNHGQQGRDLAAPSEPPHVVLQHVAALGVGPDSDHACAALDDGRIVCWGANDQLQLGSSPAVDSYLPLRVPVTARTAQLSSGMYSICLADDQGALSCWGDWGGTGPSPVTAGPNLGAGFRSLSTAAQFGCGVTGAGALSCWGTPSFSQRGTTQPGFIVSPLPGVEVAQVATAYFHTCAVLRDGRVTCWGLNYRNVLGPLKDGGIDDSPLNAGLQEQVPLPRFIAGVDDAVEVATGHAHTCIRRANGKVACWGWGLGSVNGDPNGVTTMVPRDIPGLERVTSVVAGFQHTCVVVEDRDVLCWGENKGGAVGLPVDVYSASTPQRVQF